MGGRGLIIITWLTDEAKFSRDYIPPSLLAEPSEARSHHCTWPGGSATATCSVSVQARRAVLDYGGPHAAENRTRGLFIGEARLNFLDDARTVLGSVDWREEGGAGFKSMKVRIENDADFEAAEGDPQLVEHLRRERDSGLRDLKIASSGSHACEACGFDFEQAYGLDPYCEVHHRVPVSEGPRVTSLDELAILCANCHRAIHRTKPMMSVEAFRRTHVDPRRPTA